MRFDSSSVLLGFLLSMAPNQKPLLTYVILPQNHTRCAIGAISFIPQEGCEGLPRSREDWPGAQHAPNACILTAVFSSKPF